ncbi:ABC transporter ATP-binding protein [Rhabdothermincola sp.]|uniref:ABC transporter ATP-binding protein n=1 Tax=Rhabdothermincola sp. TaxID=2820405 RepID=UPI002FDFC549
MTKSYGRVRGIVAIDLRVERGEVFGFLGPNGAGKTTTIRTLLDLQRPTSGRATLLGMDSRRDSVAIKRRVGYLTGELALYERLTGREHLAWLARLRGGIDPGALGALTERFGVELDRPIRDLSKGNRQKIGLVQAMMHGPELLILDEPTSGLDPLVQDEFLRLVQEIAASGRTVFLSSHDLDEVQRVAGRVGIVRDGRLVAVEAVETLRRRALRHVEITFARPVDSSAFRRLEGVVDATAHGPVVKLSVRGALDAIVKEAARYPVVDLLSQPADLEEIFLEYYRQEPGEER